MIPTSFHRAAATAALLVAALPCRAFAENPVPPAKAAPASPKAKQSPDDMLEMEVHDVIDVEDHHAVILSPKGTDTLVPIFIGDTEALAIALRLHRQSPPRPMTHDLLEKVIHTLGARVTKIYIDDLRDSVYLGRVFLQYGEKSVELDARPSDSIALAVGSQAPIFAARKVIDQAGVTRKEMDKKQAPSQSGKDRPGPESRDDTL